MKSQFKKDMKTLGIWILFILILLAFTLLSFEYYACYLFGNSLNYRGEYVRLITTIVAGILAIIALWLNQKRTKALEDQTINQTHQIELTRKGQVDERFKNAIEHLGSENPAIVLGGIHALHRIAKDDESYRSTVFDILCCYIREKTANEKLWSEYTEEEKRTIKPSIVIQTIIDLLFKRIDRMPYIYNGLSPNLDGIRCVKADFSNTFLLSADIRNAHLEYSNFRDAQMTGARLVGSNFKGSNMKKAHLEGAIALFCDFTKVNLAGVYFQGANLFLAHMEEAILWEAHLEGAGLYGVHLEYTSFTDAHLEGAYFVRAYLEGANLNKAHLEGAFLNETHMEGANLTDAHLEGANIKDIFVEGADLTRCSFEGVSLFKTRLLSPQKISLLDAMDKEYHPLNLNEFTNIIQDRIGKEGEFSSVNEGKLNEVKANAIIEKMSLIIKDEKSLANFILTIESAKERKTNIGKDAIVGVLSRIKASEIIERYNKAMENFPIDV